MAVSTVRPASADYVRLAISTCESEYGTPPGGPYQTLRITGEGLKQSTSTTRSNEIRDDAQDADVIRTDVSVEGPLNFEMSHGTFDAILASVFRQSPNPVEVTYTASTIAFTATDTITDSANGLGSFVVGQWIRISGSVDNEGLAKVATVAAGTLTVSNFTVTTEGAGSPITLDQIGLTGYDESGPSVTAATISFTAPDTISDSANGLGAFNVGEWIRISGSTTNDGVAKVATVAAGTLTVTHKVILTAGAGPSVTLEEVPFLVNGTTESAFSVERTYTDLASEIARFVGIKFGGMSLAVNVQDIVTGSLTTRGSLESSQTTSNAAELLAATTSQVWNTIDHVQAVFEDGTAIGITNFTAEINNNPRALSEVGELGAIDVALGKFQVSGTVETYYRDKTLYDKYLNFTDTAWALVFVDTAGNVDILELPAAVLTDGGRPASGPNTDVKASFSFETKVHATEGITARWASIAA